LINIVAKYHSDKVTQEVHILIHRQMHIKLPNHHRSQFKSHMPISTQK